MSKNRILHSQKQGKQNGRLSNSEFNLMNPKDSGLAKFYQIFKVHKLYKEGDLLPARPIIYNIGSLTENISIYVDHHTKTWPNLYLPTLKIQGFFLSLCEKINHPGDLKDDHILVTLDVISIYQHFKTRCTSGTKSLSRNKA